MFLSIRHTTSYAYDQAVILEPHIIRLTPRLDAYRRMVERTLTIIPEPDKLTPYMDENGNLAHTVCFKRQTLNLTIISNVLLEIEDFNPFDFIVYPLECTHLPMRYPSDMAVSLKPYMLNQLVHEKVHAFTARILHESKNNVLEFTSLLCRKIREECVYETRQHGEAHAPEKVLSNRRGSCRDMAVLYVAAARAAGLAARFVTGYYFDQSPKHPQLHAWAEVFIPGGGWRGFDPTLGLACYGHHIALAAGFMPSQTSVIEGIFLGKPESQMQTGLEYEYLKQLTRPVVI